ncbi:MAG: diguanylate cyclase [Coleofasciculaceae cyanobacterium SM2_3_26]|nr:diguanylate cyclase [Coleofasciculaceae cyanobacterium SM2_3_26]
MPQKSTQKEHLLHRITRHIRRSLELQEILATTVREIRLFLGVDRVKVYRFEADDSGEVMAESVWGDRLPSLLGLHFPAEDIPFQVREMFVKARCRVIVDVVHQQKTLSQLDAWETGECLDVEKVRYASVDPCHVEYLLSMGISASLSVPILHRDRLWGLLVAHHGESYPFQESQLQIVQLLVDQVSIAIAQSELLVQAKEQARREALTHRISSLLYSSLYKADLSQPFLEEVARAFGGCGARLYLTPEPLGMPAHTYIYGEQPTEPSIEETAFWQEKIQTLTGQGDGSIASHIHTDKDHPPPSPDCFSGILHPFAIRCVQSDPDWKPLATAFASAAIRSMLVIPLQYHDQCVGYLSVFRAGCDREVVWAGRSHPDKRNYRPRQSFAAWCELQTNQTQEWSDSDLKLARALSMHLYVAIMQRRIAATIGHQASHDPLTSLPNRLLFDQQLSLALPLARQRGELVAVAFLDLDRFKTVNDTLSHAVGDRLLQKVTERLRSCIHQYDSVARWGGDEFTFMLGKVNSIADADERARRVLDSLSTPFCIDDRELYITGSLGIAIAPYDGEDAQTSLK